MCFMMKWSSEGMKAKLPIYVNFSRPWKSCAYYKAKVHLTTLTSQYYMDKAHAEWKPPFAETGNEKMANFKRGFLHEGSDPRPWGSVFPCCTTEATLQGTRWCSVSMVSCGASGNTKSRGLEFDCRRKTQISSLSLVHDKTQDSE